MSNSSNGMRSLEVIFAGAPSLGVATLSAWHLIHLAETHQGSLPESFATLFGVLQFLFVANYIARKHD